MLSLRMTSGYDGSNRLNDFVRYNFRSHEIPPSTLVSIYQRDSILVSFIALKLFKSYGNDIRCVCPCPCGSVLLVCFSAQ